MVAKNDLQLLQQLDAYPQRAISTTTSRKIAEQIWYLSEDLILLSLFERQVDAATKQAMLKASTQTEGKSDLPKRLVFIGLPDGFLDEDPDSWNDKDDYKNHLLIGCDQ